MLQIQTSRINTGVPNKPLFVQMVSVQWAILINSGNSVYLSKSQFPDGGQGPANLAAGLSKDGSLGYYNPLCELFPAQVVLWTDHSSLSSFLLPPPAEGSEALCWHSWEGSGRGADRSVRHKRHSFDSQRRSSVMNSLREAAWWSLKNKNFRIWETSFQRPLDISITFKILNFPCIFLWIIHQLLDAYG